MNTRANENSFYAYFLFFIWPFLAIIISFKNFKSSWAKNLVWLFVIFYGFTFVISNEGMDANRYRDNFYSYVDQNYNLLQFVQSIYSESDKVDVLQSSINYLVASFTDNYHILFAVYGLFFGYFYSRNIWYLLSRVTTRLKAIHIILLICFSFIVGFWEINGFRFWTATHMFLFGLLRILYEKKNKYILICLLSIFVHFSFALPLVVLILYLFIGNRITFFFYLFVATFFITEINVGDIKENLIFLPDIFFDRTEGYLNEDYKLMIEERRAAYNWYALYYKEIFNWAMFIIIIVFYYKLKNLLLYNKYMLRLFSFTLLFGSFANIISNMPSGGRFISLSHLLMIALLFLYFQSYKSSGLVKNITYLAYPIFFLFIILSLRIAFITMSLTVVTGNPFFALLNENETSLLELLK